VPILHRESELIANATLFAWCGAKAVQLTLVELDIRAPV
jgi:hypothetical protein